MLYKIISIYVYIQDLPTKDKLQHFCPPITFKVYEKRAFGVKLLIGSHVVYNLPDYLVLAPWQQKEESVKMDEDDGASDSALIDLADEQKDNGFCWL